MSLQTEKTLDDTYLMPTYARKNVEFVRGEGVRLYDDTGRDYIDCLAGIACASCGHANPAVSSAIASQAAKLMQVGNYYYVEGRGELAQKLNDLLNDGLTAEGAKAPVWRTFFSNSGAEANECAIKLARRYGHEELHGATTIVTAARSFHGRTLATLAATGQPAMSEPFTPVPQGFVYVPFNDIDALIATLDDPGASTVHSKDLGKGEAFSLDISLTAPLAPVCAVMLECIQGEGGVYPADDDYLKAVRAACDKRGILLILDEVQTGIYRTGKPFAFQHYGITPDIVTMAKGIAGGFPMGATAARGGLASLLGTGDHGSTFGGNPLAVAAANAAQDFLAENNIAHNVQETGAYLRSKLEAEKLVSEVRGKGLMLGCDVRSECANLFVNMALKKGVVANATSNETLRFVPPLVMTKADVDELMERLRPVFDNFEDWSEHFTEFFQ
jgi:acetylornithine aminotransferase